MTRSGNFVFKVQVDLYFYFWDDLGRIQMPIMLWELSQLAPLLKNENGSSNISNSENKKGMGPIFGPTFSSNSGVDPLHRPIF